jgi:hypothetical protein
MRLCLFAMLTSACLSSLVATFARAAEPAAMREILRLRIVNDAQGEIVASHDRGATWRPVGRVLRYTTQVNRRGYTASKWAPPSHVAATAVNAIHISAGYNAEEDRGVVISLLPRDFLAAPATYSSFLSPDSSIYTDIPAGEGVFGGGGAPFVGDAVYLETDAGLSPLPDGYIPAEGDVLVITVARPARYPSSAVFENRAGGPVTLIHTDGSEEQLGWVVKPVGGVGRFLGSTYSGIGRLRANHTGVVDISSSPIGELGAFQILPFGHALSPEMGIAWTLTQWMVVGPLQDSPSPWDGLAPLFSHHLRPDYLADDLLADDWRDRLLSRFLCEVDLGQGWQPFPARRLSSDPAAPLPDWAGQALANVKRFRFLFPLAARAGVQRSRRNQQ